MKKVKTVDSYIKSFPVNIQSKIKKVRNIVKLIAPEAEEKISYGMPYYSYKGRLIYFAAWKTHLAMYMLPHGDKRFEKELNKYKTSRSTVKFSFDKEIPYNLIKQFVKYRLKENLERAKNKI